VATATAIPASRLNGQPDRPNMVAVGTVVWLASELMFFAALFAAYFNVSGWGMREWFIVTYVMGAIFIGGQALEYAELVHENVTIASSGYGSVFYLTTGFHGLHVTGGLIAFLLVLGRTYMTRRFTHEQAVSAIVVSYYWHFVDVVWIGLFFTIYVLQ
jgi:cytochrome c oxidase subunit 3